MLSHKTARSKERVFTVSWGGGPGVIVVNADKDGILRVRVPKGEPLENGVPVEQVHPEVRERLVSVFRDQIVAPEPEPEGETGLAPVPEPVPEGRRPTRQLKGAEA